MMPDVDRHPFTDSEFRWFSDWLREEYGLRFGPEKRDILRSRLEPRLAALGFDSFQQLFFHLKYHPDREREREKLVAGLTNKESYFFREPAQLDVLRDEILPGLRDRGSADGFRILSAGCAAGEEAYSIAIVVRESDRAGAADVHITGVDVDGEAIERARVACYRERAFRRTDPAVRDRYFTFTDAGCWQLDDSIRRAVRFERANLVEPGWSRPLPPQHVIFCRNVLIYFDDDSIRKVIDSLYDLVRPGGTLFLGHAESLSRVPTKFVPVRRPGVVHYRHPD